MLAPLLAALLTAASAQDHARNTADLDYVKAALGRDAAQVLIEREWQSHHLFALAGAIRAASAAVGRLHGATNSHVARFYQERCSVAGPLTNLNETARWVAGDHDNAEYFKRGCLSHQQATYDAVLKARPSGLAVRKITVGAVLEHHAVVVFPDGYDWRRSGVVLDAWYCQSAAPRRMTYFFDRWQPFMGRPRLED